MAVWGDFEYEDRGDYIEIIGYDENAPKDVVIPNEIGGKPVTDIGADAFKNMFLDSVTLPKNIKNIWENAFRYNFELSHVELSNGLEYMGYSCFDYNAITQINIPKTVHTIKSFAFERSPSLNTAIINNKNTVIENIVFRDVPRGFTIIGHDPSTAKDYALANGHNFDEIQSPSILFNFGDGMLKELATKDYVDKMLGGGN